MENPEKILMDLNLFEKSPVSPIPSSLEEYLEFISRTGNTVFPWPKIKPLFKLKLETTLTEFNETLPCEPGIAKMPNVESFKYSEMKERMMEQFESYSGVPFTVQRLCELLVQPTKHYKRIDKFMRGLEKVMLVVSTIEPGSGNPSSEPDPPAPIRNGTQESAIAASPRLAPVTGHVSPVLNGDGSPVKRLRLSPTHSQEGPCDSRQELQEAAGDTGETGEAAMEIDTECTSSQHNQDQEADTANEKESGLGGNVASLSDDVSTSKSSDDKEGSVDNGDIATEPEPEKGEGQISDSSDVVVTVGVATESESVEPDNCSSSADSVKEGESEHKEENEGVDSSQDIVSDTPDTVPDAITGSEELDAEDGADSSDSLPQPPAQGLALTPKDEILPSEGEQETEERTGERKEEEEQPSSCSEAQEELKEQGHDASSSGDEVTESSAGADSTESEAVEKTEPTALEQSDSEASSAPEPAVEAMEIAEVSSSTVAEEENVTVEAVGAESMKLEAASGGENSSVETTEAEDNMSVS